MPSIATKSVTSPDISVLGYSILYDISSGVPAITITNQSTVTNAANLTWWYVISTPSGIPIHEGSFADPDVVSSTWTTLVVPEIWPTPFGPAAPFGQIEFSCSLPYICTLYVQDSNEDDFSLEVDTLICRPNGNTDATQGNFGGAVCSAQTDCTNAKLDCLDSTNYSYKGSLGTFVNNAWRLVYPQYDATTPTPDATSTNTSSVEFALGWTGKGYTLVFQSYRLYDQSNGSAIKIQYKFYKVFAVWCGINLCPLNCAIDGLYQQSLNSCSQVENQTIKEQLNTIALLYGQLVGALVQPFCGEDKVPNLIAEIKRVGKFTCDCDCPIGLNPGPTNPESTGGTIQVPVYMRGTEAPPATCPNSYFPAKIYTPDGLTFLGMAYSADDVPSILNNSGAWSSYGMWFAQGNCTMGLFPSTPGQVVPAIQIDLATVTTAISGRQYYLVGLSNTCSSGPITPQSFSFASATVDFGGGTVPLGAIADLTAYLAALNGATGKPASISFTASGSVYPLYIQVNNTNSALFSTAITLAACPTASGAPTLQAVTSAGNITTNDIIVGSTAGTDDNIIMAPDGWRAFKGAVQQAGLYFAGFWTLLMKRGAYYMSVFPGVLTADRAWTLPDKSDTFAGLSDITSKTLFMQYVGVTYANTGTAPSPTDLVSTGAGSRIIPAGSLSQYCQLRITGHGKFVSSSGLVSNSFILDFIFNDGTADVTYAQAIIDVVGSGPMIFDFDCMITITNTTASAQGKVIRSAVYNIAQPWALYAAPIDQSPIAFDRSLPQTLKVVATWFTGNTLGLNTSVSLYQLTMEQLR